MNTADRSIGHLDYAVRRRFAFVHCPASRDEVVQYYDSNNGDLQKLALDLFDKVSALFEELLSGDYQAKDVRIGHTYFMARSVDQLKAKFRYQVLPLLDEYLADGVLRAHARVKLDVLRHEVEV